MMLVTRMRADLALPVFLDFVQFFAVLLYFDGVGCQSVGTTVAPVIAGGTTTSWLGGIVGQGSTLSAATMSANPTPVIGQTITGSPMTSGTGAFTAATTPIPSTQPQVVRPNDELLYVITMWRHGQRNPVQLFDEDIHTLADFPEGPGELTLKGLDQLYQLGEALRSRYVDMLKLLSPRYSPKEIYVRATNYNRTMQSGDAVLAGLYSQNVAGQDVPLSSGWDPLFVPIPIHSDNDDDINFFTFYNTCPRRLALNAYVQNSTLYKDFINATAPLMTILSNVTGENMTVANSLSIADVFMAEKSLGMQIAPWAAPYVDEFIAIFADYYSAFMGFGLENVTTTTTPKLDVQKELRILNAGYLTNQIVDELVRRANCESDASNDTYCSVLTDRKLYAFSGHDVTIMLLFRGLNFEWMDGNEPGVPGYGACVIMELWQDNDFDSSANNTLASHYIKLLYMKNSTTRNVIDLAPFLDYCTDGKCPLDVLAKQANDIRPKSNVTTMCNAPLSSAPPINFSPVLFLALCLVIMSVNSVL